MFSWPKEHRIWQKILSYLSNNNLCKKSNSIRQCKSLPNLYKNAEINVFLSEIENCPNILLEALSSKKPVLCSNKQPMINLEVMPHSTAIQGILGNEKHEDNFF